MNQNETPIVITKPKAIAGEGGLGGGHSPLQLLELLVVLALGPDLPGGYSTTAWDGPAMEMDDMSRLK